MVRGTGRWPLIGGSLTSEDCKGSGTVMNLGDSGGTGGLRARVVGVVLKACRDPRAGAAATADEEILHAEMAAWRPHIDGLGT